MGRSPKAWQTGISFPLDMGDLLSTFLVEGLSVGLVKGPREATCLPDGGMTVKTPEVPRGRADTRKGSHLSPAGLQGLLVKMQVPGSGGI